MKWQGDIHCKVCGADEDTDHVIFSCSVARYQWMLIRDVLNWESVPTSIESFLRISLHSKLNNSKISQKVVLLVLGAVVWCIWLARNDLVFNNRFPSSIFALTFKSILLLQKWALLSKVSDREVLKSLMEAIRIKSLELQHEERRGVSVGERG